MTKTKVRPIQFDKKMKAKFNYIFTVLTAAALVSACSESPSISSRDVIRGTRVTEINGVLDDAVKSGYALATDEGGNPILHTYWTEGDRIAVTDGASSAVYGTSTGSDNAETAANFTGDGYFELENGLWAVYPSTALIARDSEKLTVTVNNVTEQDEAGKFVNWGINDLKIGYGIANDDVPAIRFKNLLATLKVNLKLAADHGIEFGRNETVKSVNLTAVGNEKMAGDFTIPLAASATELTPTAHTFSEMSCIMLEDTELSTDQTVSIFFTVAPGTYSQILVTINTSVRTIQRTIAINTNLERNNFYNINLTKIKNAAPYTVIEDIPVDEGGWGDSISTASKSSGAVVALWDGLYDDTLTGRYYTVQLARDAAFTNIVETTNIQITYSTLYGGGDDQYLDDGRITFCGLQPNTRYYYRVKVMGVGDEYYSRTPNTFITTARKTASAMGCSYYIDFDDILSYGTGDFMGRAVATYPGATPTSEADDAEWNDRLGFVSTSEHYSYWNGLANPAASYKVGSTYGCMLIPSSGNPNAGIHYSNGSAINAGTVLLDTNEANNIENVRNRPGYIQLGTGSGTGFFKLGVGTVSLARNKTTSVTVKFKACAFNNQGKTQDAAIKVNLYAKSSARVSPCEIEGNATVNIPYDASYTWREYTVTVTTNKTTDGTDAGSLSIKYDYPRVLTFSTAKNAAGSYVRVFVDDVQIN